MTSKLMSNPKRDDLLKTLIKYLNGSLQHLSYNIKKISHINPLP